MRTTLSFQSLYRLWIVNRQRLLNPRLSQRRRDDLHRKCPANLRHFPLRARRIARLSARLLHPEPVLRSARGTCGLSRRAGRMYEIVGAVAQVELHGFRQLADESAQWADGEILDRWQRDKGSCGNSPELLLRLCGDGAGGRSGVGAVS